MKMCLFFTCYVSLQVRVQCWSLQDVTVEPDNPNQIKVHQEAPSGQQALQLVRSFSVDNAGVIFKITTYICE